MSASGPHSDSGSFGTGEEPAPEPVAAGQRIGKYRLSFLLAAGGMGTVYLARAEGPHGYEKLVALKQIHPHLARDPKFVAMFLDEARIAARIGHPNVCGVIDFGEADGSYFFAMPFLFGESLTNVLRALRRQRGGAAWDRVPSIAARLVADACEGLHAAHELTGDDGSPLNVVHRDVSPHNLMVGYDGVTRVLDFGVASASQRLHSTATGEVKGKFAYMAPEQLDGEAVDRRADVWSLGVVLWEALALERLFGGRNMTDTVKAVMTRAVPPLRDLRPDVPLGLEEVVFRALARDPEARYPTARAMGRDLNAFLVEHGEVVSQAEVAEWMGALFPEGQESKRQLVEQAKARDSVDEVPWDVQRERSSRAEALAVGGTPSATAPVEEASSAERKRGAGVWIAIVAAVAASALTVVGLRYLDTEAGEASEARPVPAGTAAQEASAPRARAEKAAAGEGIRADDAAEPGRADQGDQAGAASSDERADGERDDRAGGRDEDSGQNAAPAVAGSEAQRSSARRRDGRGAARGPGALRIATPGGWAIVFADGRRLGEAPGSFSLPAGRHTIEVQPFGRGDRIRRRVRVTRGSTARLSVPVSPAE